MKHTTNLFSKAKTASKTPRLVQATKTFSLTIILHVYLILLLVAAFIVCLRYSSSSTVQQQQQQQQQQQHL